MSIDKEVTGIDELISGLEAVNEGRTPGPWKSDIYDSDDERYEDRANVIGALGDMRKQCLVRELQSMAGNCTDRQRADAHFIAFMGTNADAILSALKRVKELEVENARLIDAARNLIIVQYQIADTIEGLALRKVLEDGK